MMTGTQKSAMLTLLAGALGSRFINPITGAYLSPVKQLLVIRAAIHDERNQVEIEARMREENERVAFIARLAADDKE
jgi:hypothetical protein